MVQASGGETATGDAGPNEISGGSQTTTIHGMGGDDMLRVGGMHVYVYGGEGNDTIVGGAGNDHLYGFGSTAGQDGADSIMGGAGDDYIQGNAGNDLLDGGDGNDRMQGGADNDTMFGGGGDDALNGNRGNDTLYGGAGNDVVRGGQGDDRLFGEDGNDHLYGDLGVDTMTGGAGNDVFHFGSADSGLLNVQRLLTGVDRITDFTDGQDRIALDFTPSQVAHGDVQSTLAGALSLAQGLLTGGDEHTVAAVQVGSDTYLFYGNGGLLSGNVVELLNTSADTIARADFV